VTARLAALGLLVVVAGGCATVRSGDRVAAVRDCPVTHAVGLEAPLPERPQRWWWGAAEPGRVAMRSSFGLDGCPPVLQ
jgi:hypothetical protein